MTQTESMQGKSEYFNNLLEHLGEEAWPDHPASLDEGCWCGPWRVEQQGEIWKVSRDYDGKVFAEFEFRETALMFAAVLPIAFRSPTYTAESPTEGMVWKLKMQFGERGYSSIGRFLEFHDEFLPGLDFAHALLISPHSLANFLEAAPRDVLVQAGSLLQQRLSVPQRV